MQRASVIAVFLLFAVLAGWQVVKGRHLPLRIVCGLAMTICLYLIVVCCFASRA